MASPASELVFRPSAMVAFDHFRCPLQLRQSLDANAKSAATQPSDSVPRKTSSKKQLTMASLQTTRGDEFERQVIEVLQRDPSVTVKTVINKSAAVEEGGANLGFVSLVQKFIEASSVNHNEVWCIDQLELMLPNTTFLADTGLTPSDAQGAASNSIPVKLANLMKPDVIKLERIEGGDEVLMTVIDIKSSTRMKRGHCLQISFYDRFIAWLLQSLRDDHPVKLRVSLNDSGEVWLPAKGLDGPGTEASYGDTLGSFVTRHVFALPRYRGLLHEFFAQVVPMATAIDIEDVPWRLNDSCSTCDFVTKCKKQAVEARDAPMLMGFVDNREDAEMSAPGTMLDSVPRRSTKQRQSEFSIDAMRAMADKNRYEAFVDAADVVNNAVEANQAMTLQHLRTGGVALSRWALREHMTTEVSIVSCAVAVRPGTSDSFLCGAVEGAAVAEPEAFTTLLRERVEGNPSSVVVVVSNTNQLNTLRAVLSRLDARLWIQLFRGYDEDVCCPARYDPTTPSTQPRVVPLVNAALASVVFPVPRVVTSTQDVLRHLCSKPEGTFLDAADAVLASVDNPSDDAIAVLCQGLVDGYNALYNDLKNNAKLRPPLPPSPVDPNVPAGVPFSLQQAAENAIQGVTVPDLLQRVSRAEERQDAEAVELTRLSREDRRGAVSLTFDPKIDAPSFLRFEVEVNPGFSNTGMPRGAAIEDLFDSYVTRCAPATELDAAFKSLADKLEFVQAVPGGPRYVGNFTADYRWYWRHQPEENQPPEAAAALKYAIVEDMTGLRPTLSKNGCGFLSGDWLLVPHESEDSKGKRKPFSVDAVNDAAAAKAVGFGLKSQGAAFADAAVVDIVGVEKSTAEGKVWFHLAMSRTIPLRRIGRKFVLVPRYVNMTANKIETALTKAVRAASPSAPLEELTPIMAFAMGSTLARRAAGWEMRPLRLVPEDTLPPARATKFTDRQRAFFHSVAQNPLSVLWGPPGTGKTSTLANLLLMLLVERGGVSEEEPFRVMVVGMSRNAQAEVRRRLAQLLPRSADPEPNVKPAGDAADDYVDGPEKKFRDALAKVTWKHIKSNPESERSEEFAVVVCGSVEIAFGTCYDMHKEYGAGNKAKMPPRDMLIVDEASQMRLSLASIASLCLKPLTDAAGGRSRLILAGDALQLPPIVPESTASSRLCRTNENIRYLATKSALECVMFDSDNNRIDTSAGIKAGVELPPYVTMLDMSFRSIAPIVHLVATLYPKLDCPAHIESLPLARNPLRLRVVPTSADERDAVMNSVTEAVNKGHVTIGVVTPHRRQRALYKRGFAMIPHGNHITIVADTVERLQGREFDAVVLALADVNEAFTFQLRRLNVAMSRAKKDVTLVTTSAILNPDETTLLERAAKDPTGDTAAATAAMKASLQLLQTFAKSAETQE